MQGQEKRIFKILDMLDEKARVLQGARMAAYLGVSSRTVRNDIKAGNAMLKGEGAEILSEPGTGYTLRVYDRARYMAFRTLQLQENEQQYIIPSDHSERISFIIAHPVNERNENKTFCQSTYRLHHCYFSVHMIG